MAANRSYKKKAVKVDINKKVTDIILAQLKEGVLPWKQPYVNTDFPSLTRYHSGEPYKGINTVLLWIAKQQHQFQSNGFLTFNQATEVAGIDKDTLAKVRDKKNKDFTLESINHPLAGQKSSAFVVFNSPIYKDANNKTWGKTLSDGTVRRQPTRQEIAQEDIKTIWVSKTYATWNIDQMSYIPEKWHEKRNNAGKVFNEDILNSTQDERIKALVDDLIQKNGIKIKHSDRTPFLDLDTNVIYMPKIQEFVSDSSYYKTLAHELSHWSGSKNNLDRGFDKFINGTASPKELAMEELIAELTSCFLAQKIGVDGISSTSIEGHTRYIKTWIDLLGDNEKAITFAASAAEKACNFLTRSLEMKVELNNDDNGYEP